MHASNSLLFLATTGLATASMIAERVPSGALDARSIQQGWSIQASTAPVGTIACGNGSFCPSTLNCNPAANDEVAACCTTTDCRGTIEGAPACADSSWSLWKGLNGNGFCCAVDQVGIYDYHNPVAGTCVAAAAATGATTAVLMSTGSATGPVVTATSSSIASLTSGSASATTAPSSAASASVSSPAASKASLAASASASPSASASASVVGSSTASSSAANASSTGKTSSGAEKRVVASLAVAAMGLLAAFAL